MTDRDDDRDVEVNQDVDERERWLRENVPPHHL